MALSIGELVGYIDLDTSGAESAVDRVGGLLSGKGGKWGAILGGVGAGAGLAFAGSLMGAVDREVGSDRLAASLGKGSGAAERYGQIAGEVFSNGFGDGLEDVNTAMGAVITSIKGMRNASDGEVQKMTEKAMTLADVLQVDVTRAAQVAGNMVYNGMAKDGTEAFDLLMKAMQKVPVQLREDVMDATDEYGQFFTQLGIDGPEAMGLLAKGAEKGMYGIDKMGDAVKEFTIRATDGSKSTYSAFETIGVNGAKMEKALLQGGDAGAAAFDKIVDGLLNVDDPFKRANASLQLFGTPLEDLGTKDIPKFLKSLQGGQDKLGDFKGAVDDAGETAYDNASTNLTMFKRTLQTGFVDMIGGKVLPKVTEMTGALANGLGPAVSAVSDFLRKHSAVIGPLAVVLGTMAGGIALVIGAVRVWTGVQAALNTVLAMNPIGLVVIAIAGLVAGLIYAYKKSETFRAVVDGAFGAVKKVAGGVLDWLADAIRTTIDWVKSHWGLLLGILGGPLGLAVALVVKHWGSIKSKTGDAIDTVVGFVKGIPGRFTGALSSLAETVRGLFRDAMDAGKDKVTGIGSTIVGWIEGIPGKLLGKLGAFTSAGRQLLQGFVDGMKNAAGVIEGLAGNVWTTVRGLINGAITKINAALEFTINLPGKNLTINPPDIPQLATGGRATAATLAVIGEGREPESVLPDSVLRGLLERAHAAGAAQGGGGNGRNAPLIGKVVQAPNQSTDQLAEALWFKTRTRG